MASDRFRQDEAQFRAARPGGVDLREWLLSLPFVVEVDPDMDSVGLLAIDCPLLERRRIWAATGLGYRDPRRGLERLALAAYADAFRYTAAAPEDIA